MNNKILLSETNQSAHPKDLSNNESKEDRNTAVKGCEKQSHDH